MGQFNDNNFCFVCGTGNPLGLKLNFHYDAENDQVVSTTSFEEHFQGWEGVLHGGLISTVLDEVMIKAASQKGFKCVTAELNVRFKKPAELHRHFTLKGRVSHVNNRLVSAEGTLLDSEDTVVASADGKFIRIDTR